jgi:glycosyltransferase involved in cell wall biosynthesis
MRYLFARFKLRRLTEGLKRSGLPDDFDPATYLRLNPDVHASGLDAARHYLRHGRRERRPYLLPRTSVSVLDSADGQSMPDHLLRRLPEGFDPQIYAELNEDVRRAGVDPAEHYALNGEREQRPWKFPQIAQLMGLPRDESRQTVLVVSHDASRSGAPILSLNIARELSSRYNLVILLIGPGPLVEHFLSVASEVVHAPDTRGNLSICDRLVNDLVARYAFAYAIVNSIESRFVLQALACSSVGTVSLIHEFASYTRPKDAFQSSFLWSDRVVFSARLTLNNAVRQSLESTRQISFSVLPQGKCTVPADPANTALFEAERARLTRVMGTAGKQPGSLVLLGAGAVQYRKGVDLFLEVAARVIHSPGGAQCRFIWAGGGFDPDRDVAYSVYLADQIERAGLQEHVVFIGEVRNIELAYALSDALLLTSRLDPLPNVAIDALFAERPVICFEGASGIADFLSASGLGDETVARYLDTSEMAQKVLGLLGSREAHRKLAERSRTVAEKAFDLPSYVERLDNLGIESNTCARRQSAELEALLNCDALDPEYMRFPDNGDSAEQAARRYLRSWRSGLLRRKPLAGFHPGVYAEMNGVNPVNQDPFVHWLQAGKPSGPWRVEMIDGRAAWEPRSSPVKSRVALHLHAYYPELVPALLGRLALNITRPDIFVSVKDEQARREVSAMLGDYAVNQAVVTIVPNRGRDIGPLLTEFGRDLVSSYELVGHLHTKRSPGLVNDAFVSRWLDFILENLIGGASSGAMMDRILQRMADDPTIGLIRPDDPNIVDWSRNLDIARPLSSRLGFDDLPAAVDFPVGTMFWMRSSNLTRFVNLGLVWDDYPEEPLPYDGTMLHAIERLLGMVGPGTRVVATRTSGVTR